MRHPLRGMRVVLTGGAGFLGSHFADLLLERGHSVVAVDNMVTGSPRNVAHLAGRDDFQLIEADISEGLEIEGPVDAVANLASPASPVDFTRIPLEVLRVGSRGTENALELARKKGARFLMASTSEVYGDPLVSPQSETYWGNVNPIGIRSVYDEAKRFSEAMTMAYCRYRGVDTRIVRFFNTYGPRMRLDDGRVVPNFVRQALAGEPITVYGDGMQTRSFGYVGDILQGVYALLSADPATERIHEPFNIGTQEERTMLQFAELVRDLVGSRSEITHLPAASDDPKQRRPDAARAKAILGWEPSVSVEDGLRTTIEAFRKEMAVD